MIALPPSLLHTRWRCNQIACVSVHETILPGMIRIARQRQPTEPAWCQTVRE